MVKGFFTQQELINAKILIDANRIESKRLLDLIKTHQSSPEYKSINEGVKYFEGKHDILNFVPTYWLDGRAEVDKTKANMRMPHLFHSILVDQKASYMVGNPIVIGLGKQDDTEDLSKKSAEERKQLQVEKIKADKAVLADWMTLLGDSFDDVMNDWVIQASNQIVGWIHFFIDEQGKLQYLVCDSRELIPVYDSQYQKNLVAMIRYYQMDEITEGDNSSFNYKKRYRVEWWTEKDVTYYVQIDDETFVLDPAYPVNPAGHFISFNNINPKQVDQRSWDAIPFVSLVNNSKYKTDLDPIKPLIDAYDKVASGWINDLIELQEMILVLKGYSALRGEAQRGLSELALFLQNLKNHKVVTVEEGGDVTALKIDIPVEAKNKFLQITREAIFYFGRGVDVSSDKFGNNPSGISLKFLYASLDMKVNTLIRKMTTSLTKFMYFIAKYNEIAKVVKSKLVPEDLVYTFNKAVIFNEKEKVDMLKASEGMISQQTILENHPLVQDAAEEKARMDEEEQANMEKGLVQLSQFNQDSNKNPNDLSNQDSNVD